jgi:hypothetical protein
MKSGITGHHVTTSKRQLPKPNTTRMHLAPIVHPSHIPEKVDINQTGKNKISESANWQGVLEHRGTKQMAVKQGLGVWATL